MKVEKISDVEQLNRHKELKENNRKKSWRGRDKDLSFSDVIELMRHTLRF
ncbi:hypothetical protein [Clostridium autoethanogenum]|uniref:Uncharacterized protein n=1 Tax=Clostridium autoethanogenum DSM 10061 TaxID=1341692 RepID=A0ABN4BHF9_9CLOT|nr:hypothetical protein [Clostridium autoethanogenum]AGY75324.1 hypothetical protein CAETHG_1099 [Clostridium autoethanogenum DSM 10061]ALU35489.1 Hypothetical protein CLAU_1060 [Clostridium autoethanogenum DSM 10061]OVY48552.1 hypothetical protein WX72_00500 [Clostridium autoethanogenum]